MNRQNENRKFIVDEERPLIELPQIVFIAIIFTAFILGASLLVLPWHFVMIGFAGFAVMIGIVLNPFVGIPLFLFGSYIHPMGYAPQLVHLQIPVVVAFGVLFAWGFHIMVYRDFKLPNSRQFIFFVIFAMLASLSSFRHWDESKFYFFDLLKVLVLYFLTANLIKTHRQLSIVIFLAVFLSTVVAVSAILNQAAGVGESIISSRFTRAMSFENNPNYLAMNLNLLLPVLIGLFTVQYSAIKKVLYALLIGIFILTVILTFSRAGFLALISVLALSFWSFVWKRKKYVFAVVFIFIIIAGMLFLPQEVWERAGTISDLTEASIRGRVDGLIIGGWLIKDFPFLGTGIGRWQEEYYPRAITLPSIQYKFSSVTHNLLIEVGAQLGIPALLVFIALCYSSFKDLSVSHKIFIKKNQETMAIICRSFEIGLFGFLIFAMFAAAIDLKIFWMLLGLTVALKRTAEEK